MTKPSVGEKEMLDYLDCLEDKVGACNCTNPLRATMIEGECTDAIAAIRALILEHEKLKKAVKELGKRAKGILSNPDLMDEPDIFEFIKDVRDFGEEGK